MLEERSAAAAEIEVTHLPKGNHTDEEFEKAKKDLREAFRLKVTVTGTDGEELFGPINEVLNSTNFPDNLKSVYLNSSMPLRALYNYFPRNFLEVFLDFSKPSLFDWNLLPSQETPNASNFIVQGYDATWANGVYNEIDRFLKKRRSKLGFLHKHTVYDLLLWVAGFPFSFWVAYKTSDLVEGAFGNISPFVESAAYFYIFVLALLGIRFLFHYARWIWPL